MKFSKIFLTGAASIMVLASMGSVAVSAKNKNNEYILDDNTKIEFSGVETKVDEKTGKIMMSEDNGNTWNIIDEINTDNVKDETTAGNKNIDIEGYSIAFDGETKIDEKTGKVMLSNDGGKTWDVVDEIVVE